MRVLLMLLLQAIHVADVFGLRAGFCPHLQHCSGGVFMPAPTHCCDVAVMRAAPTARAAGAPLSQHWAAHGPRTDYGALMWMMLAHPSQCRRECHMRCAHSKSCRAVRILGADQ